MLNKEKHRETIIKIAMRGDTFGVSKTNDLPIACNSLKCEDCIFYRSINCMSARKRWLNSEYTEQPKRIFTEEQKNVVRVLDVINYIARDMDGGLWGFANKPYKNDIYWEIDCHSFYCNLDKLISIDFSQITWEDKEPTSREEILGE